MTDLLAQPREYGAEGDERDASRRAMDVLSRLLAHRGQPAAEINAILADHPQSVFAHCVRMTIIVRDDDRTATEALAASIAAITAAGSGASEGAQRHGAAATLWLTQSPAVALDAYAAIVAFQPYDVLALAVAHALDFRLGNRAALRDRVATAIAVWNESMLFHAEILAMYAFGLEENGAYRHAETVARRALALKPHLLAAIHVIAHVMEMQRRPREGLDFLAAHEAAWTAGNGGFAIHLAWHRALFHLQLGDTAGALAVYDAQIAPPSSPKSLSPNFAALADASALLWRLNLRNVDLGGRWQPLADRWGSATLADARPFFIVHAMMAFAAAGRTARAARLLAALRSVDVDDTAQTLPEDALALPVSEALLAFAAHDYVGSLAFLERVRHIADRCGGSLAQCDILQLTVVEATARARHGQMAA